MTFFSLILIVVIILAVIGLGWNTFAIAVLEGFDKALDVGIPILKNLTQEAQASTIQIPTYDPPMTSYENGGKLNGSRTLDFKGNADTAFEMVPWFNITVMMDISDYNKCVDSGYSKLQLQDAKEKEEALTLWTNNVTESQRILSLPYEEQEAHVFDHCVVTMHVSNMMNKAFGDAADKMQQKD